MDSQTYNKKFQKELLSGVTALSLLAILEQNSEPLYGYQIAKMIEESSGDMPIIKPGALYPVLRSLEKSELLFSSVEPSVSGPPRRYYTITDFGREILNEWKFIWRRTKSFTDAILLRRWQ